MSRIDVIDKVISRVKKKFKGDALTFDELDEFGSVKNWNSTGVPDIDFMLETYGLPPGISEVSGKSQSGKTTFSLHFAKEVQTSGGLPIIISTERRDNEAYARTIGLDTRHALLFKERNIEGCFGRMEDAIGFIRTLTRKVPIALILDSLGATPTKAEMKADAEQDFMAVAARAIKKMLRRITQLLDEYNVTLLAVNQTYDVIGKAFGKKTRSYGGQGISFHSQIRLEVVRLGTIKIGERKIGQISRFVVNKNDFGMPLQEIDVPILFGYGVVPGKKMLRFAEEVGVLQEYKTGYALTKLPKYRWTSLDKYYQLCIEDQTFRALFRNIMKKKVHDFVGKLKEEMRSKD